MKTNFFRTLLRWWIALTSIIGFLGGWILLGHIQNNGGSAGSSSQSVQLAPLPSLVSLPALEQSGSLRPLQVNPSFSGGFRLRTGAS